MCTRPKVIGGIHDVGSIHRGKIAYFSPMIRSQCPQKAAQEEEEKEKNKDIKKVLGLNVFLIFRCPKGNQWAGPRGPGWAGGLPLLS